MKTINHATTLGELELLLASFGLAVYATFDGPGRWLVSVDGTLANGEQFSSCKYGESLADGLQLAVAEWCSIAGDALKKANVVEAIAKSRTVTRAKVSP